MNVADQILTTRGVNSKVLVPGIVQRFQTAGHIGLFDFDGMSKQRVLDNCLELDGINILWASSLTGYHLWNLSIRTKDEVALMGLKLGSDCKHVQHGYALGKWVLRITPKFRENDTQYKPAPKLLHTWCNDSIRIQSEPHYKLFQALTGTTTAQAKFYKVEGVTAEVEDYRTMTDNMKGILHGKRKR